MQNLPMDIELQQIPPIPPSFFERINADGSLPEFLKYNADTQGREKLLESAKINEYIGEKSIDASKINPFLNILNKILHHPDKASRTGEQISLEEFFHKFGENGGIEAFIAAGEEEVQSAEYRKAYVCRAFRCYKGKPQGFHVIPVGGASGVGKTTCADTFVQKTIGDSSSADSFLMPYIDGGIPRDISRIKKMLIAVAEKKGYVIKDLGKENVDKFLNSKLKKGLKKLVVDMPNEERRNAGVAGMVVVETFSVEAGKSKIDKLKKDLKKIKDKLGDELIHIHHVMIRGDDPSTHARNVKIMGDYRALPDHIAVQENQRTFTQSSDLDKLRLKEYKKYGAGGYVMGLLRSWNAGRELAIWASQNGAKFTLSQIENSVRLYDSLTGEVITDTSNLKNKPILVSRQLYEKAKQAYDKNHGDLTFGEVVDIINSVKLYNCDTGEEIPDPARNVGNAIYLTPAQHKQFMENFKKRSAAERGLKFIDFIPENKRGTGVVINPPSEAKIYVPTILHAQASENVRDNSNFIVALHQVVKENSELFRPVIQEIPIEANKLPSPFRCLVGLLFEKLDTNVLQQFSRSSSKAADQDISENDWPERNLPFIIKALQTGQKVDMDNPISLREARAGLTKIISQMNKKNGTFDFVRKTRNKIQDIYRNINDRLLEFDKRQLKPEILLPSGLTQETTTSPPSSSKKKATLKITVVDRQPSTALQVSNETIHVKDNHDDGVKFKIQYQNTKEVSKLSIMAEENVQKLSHSLILSITETALLNWKPGKFFHVHVRNPQEAQDFIYATEHCLKEFKKIDPHKYKHFDLKKIKLFSNDPSVHWIDISAVLKDKKRTKFQSKEKEYYQALLDNSVQSEYKLLKKFATECQNNLSENGFFKTDLKPKDKNKQMMDVLKQQRQVMELFKQNPRLKDECEKNPDQFFKPE